MPAVSHVYSNQVVLGGITTPLHIGPALLTIEATRFTSVEEGPVAPLPPGTISLPHHLVTPAFVNGHTHLAMAAFRGLGTATALRGNVVEDLFFRLESELTDAEVRAFTRLGAYESLSAGVGAVFDHYYRGTAIADALAEVGLAGVVAPTLQDLAGPGRADTERELEATRTIADHAAWRQKGIVAALGPHATDTVSPALWTRLLELASAWQLPIHVHLAQSQQELERAHQRHGVSPLGLLDGLGCLDADIRWLLVHDLFLSDADLTRLDPARHTLAACPFSQVEFCFPAPIAEWHQRKLPWVVGTDAAASNDTMNVQQELRLVAGMSTFAATYSEARRAFAASGSPSDAARLDAVRRQALDESAPLRHPETLLASVWSTPGVWHPDLPVGAIEPGRFASFLVWDCDDPSLWPCADPLRALAFADATPALEWMFVAGTPVGPRGDYRRGLRSSDAYRDAHSEARARLDERLARLGLGYR